MRKRIITGAFAVVLIAVMVFFVSQPKKGSVEWHKREYLRTFDRLHELDWRSGLTRQLERRAKIRSVSFYPSRQESLSLRPIVSQHRAALIRLGYLSEKRIVFSNTSPTQAFFNRPSKDWPIEPDERFLDFKFDVPGEPSTILVIAPTSTIELWKDWLQRIDVPAGRK